MFKSWRDVRGAKAAGSAIAASRQTLPRAERLLGATTLGGTMCALSGAIIALGLGASPATAGCNSGNVANTNLLSSASCQADASGAGTDAVGFARARLPPPRSRWHTANANQFDSIAVGRNAQASGIGGIAIGSSNGVTTASGGDSVAIAADARGDQCRCRGHRDKQPRKRLEQRGVWLQCQRQPNQRSCARHQLAAGDVSSASGAASIAFGSTAPASQTGAVALASTATPAISTALPSV